jgi:hypothetical protein
VSSCLPAAQCPDMKTRPRLYGGQKGPLPRPQRETKEMRIVTGGDERDRCNGLGCESERAALISVYLTQVTQYRPSTDARP